MVYRFDPLLLFHIYTLIAIVQTAWLVVICASSIQLKTGGIRRLEAKTTVSAVGTLPLDPDKRVRYSSLSYCSFRFYFLTLDFIFCLFLIWWRSVFVTSLAKMFGEGWSLSWYERTKLQMKYIETPPLFKRSLKCLSSWGLVCRRTVMFWGV